MGLKLFRSTGHSSLLDTRTAAAWQHKVTPGGRNPLMLLTVISIWLATVGNWALWRTLSRLGLLSTLADYAFALALAVVIFGGIGFVTALLAWRRSIRWVIIILLLVAAFGMHFILTYGVAIDGTLIANGLPAGLGEARNWLSLRLIFTILLVAGLPALWLWQQPVQRLTVLRQGVRNVSFMIMCAILISIALLLSSQTFASTMRNHPELRFLVNPLSSIYALGQLASKPLRKGSTGLAPASQDASKPAL